MSDTIEQYRARGGIDPQVLVDQGILGEPRTPEQALKRARGFFSQGHFRRAVEILNAQLTAASGSTFREMTELLGRCAVHGEGGRWQSLLQEALEGYVQAGGEIGAARVRRYMGDGLISAGRLDVADRCLREASAAFLRHHHVADHSIVECLRGRIPMRAGHMNKALQQVDRALAQLAQMQQPRPEGLARLDRAHILSCQGRHKEAVKEILASQKLLNAAGTPSDRLRVSLTHAECLLSAGDDDRAASGLKRLLVHLNETEELAIHVWAHSLLGRAQSASDPTSAHAYLTRARHWYEDIEHHYHVTRCDILLTKLEVQQGTAGDGCLRRLRRWTFNEWPLFQAEALLLRAEVDASITETVRRDLALTHGFAMENGHSGLARRLDKLLHMRGLSYSNWDHRVTSVGSRLTSSRSDAALVDAGAETSRAGSHPTAVQLIPVGEDSGCVVTRRRS